MHIQNNILENWIKDKANLLMVNSGYVIDFDYEWYLKDDIDETQKEYGNYYKSLSIINNSELWIDLRQETPNEDIKKIIFILQNYKSKEHQIIKEFSPQFLEENLKNITIEEFINSHLIST